MNPLDNSFDRLQGLVNKWETLADYLRHHPHASPQEKSFAAGLEEAATELRTLLAQINGSPPLYWHWNVEYVPLAKWWEKAERSPPATAAHSTAKKPGLHG